MSTQSLIELAELVLKNNYFEFNDRFRKQKEGTTIGAKFALPYAIIFTTALEEKTLESLSKNHWLWWRYVDDVFRISHHGENELKKFIDKLNKFNTTIKFTCDYSRERVHFLHVQVILEINRISTDLYVKERHSHQYLQPSSCHP